MITLAAVITRGQTDALAIQTRYAFEQGVTPREISEIVTHLAFYVGWSNGTAAAIAIGSVFSERGIGTDQLWYRHRSTSARVAQSFTARSGSRR
nr:carboxymuconolactone decarboxylase family protein [Paraburkholderia sp. MM5384-R2]